MVSNSVYAEDASITMSVSPVSVNIIPSDLNGTVATSDTGGTPNIQIKTSNSTGYTLSIQSDSATAPALTGSNGSISSIVSATSSASDFTNGTYGYKPTKKNGASWDNLTIGSNTTGYFLPAPTSSGDVLDVTDTANTTDNEYKLEVATKIGIETAVGKYSRSFTIVAVANEPPEGVDFDDAFAMAEKSKVSGTSYYAMQDMTPEICAAVKLLSETTLVDTRDNNKTYSVAKLDDENCWMTQNLALGSDSLGEITLTSADSDVTSDFTLPTPTTTSFRSSNYDVVNYRNYTSKSTNYYNWYTATAGTGKKATAAYTAATSSICPKGWRLPDGSPESGKAGEWAELFYAAGITSSLATGTSSVSYATGGAAKRAAAPYNIPNTYGYFDTTGSAPTGTTSSYFWTNRTYSRADYAWSTYIDSSSATLNYGSRYKYQGMPMRCVAHKAETKPTITYNANGGTGAPSPTQASGAASEFAQSITLSSTKPTKSGQSFAGWNTKQDGSGSWYQPGSTITTASDTTLYAIWWTETTTFDSAFAAAGKTKVSGTDYYAMQDMEASICDNVTSPIGPFVASSAQLIDTRDNKIYWVSKLADGHCWMTQNLDLDLSTSKTLTSADTNLPEGSSWTPDKNTVVGADLSSSNWATSDDYTHQFSWDGGNYYLPDGRDKNNTACTNKNLGACTNDVTSIAALTDVSIKDNVNAHYHVGNLYTWTAALAMNDSSSVDTTPYTNPVSTSICPKGWRLPIAYGGSSSANGEFFNLITTTYGIARSAAGEETLRSSPLFFARSGYVDTGSLYNVGSFGYCWSSTVNSSSNAYFLIFASTDVYPTDSGSRIRGRAVRCIAQ